MLYPVSTRWTKTGQDQYASIFIKSGVFRYRIADENDEPKQNVTGMEWTPHDTLPDSSEYQIKLISPNDSTVSDTSDYYFSNTGSG